MRKNWIGLVVGTSTFGISLLTIWLVSSFFTLGNTRQQTVLSNEQTAELKQILYPTNPKGKVEVIFKGFVIKENYLLIDVEIINRNTTPAIYWTQDKDYPYFLLQFNGKPKDMFWCGTGAREYQILPGESLKPEISANILEDFLDKKGKVQIGFGFEFEKNKYRQYWSQSFQITDEIRTQIKNQIAEQSKIQ